MGLRPWAIQSNARPSADPGGSGRPWNLHGAEGALATPGLGGSASPNELPRPVFPEVLQSAQVESLKADKGGVFKKVRSSSLGGKDLVGFG